MLGFVSICWGLLVYVSICWGSRKSWDATSHHINSHMPGPWVQRNIEAATLQTIEVGGYLAIRWGYGVGQRLVGEFLEAKHPASFVPFSKVRMPLPSIMMLSRSQLLQP